ncbi:MAG: efflux RND transporter periplasmic adaptor subunit [Paracoccaceae bacterium]
MRTALSLLALAAAVAAAAPVQAESPVAPAETQAPSLPSITVSQVETRTLADRVMATGLIGPVEIVQVQPLIEGQPIEQLLADVGDSVTAGQVLAVLSKTSLDLEKSQYQASLASARAAIAQGEASQLEAQANADEANRAATRSAALKQQGNVSQAAYDTAQAAALTANARVMVAQQSLEAARAQLALVDAQLANVDLQLTRTQVVAPVAGRITARNAQLGAVGSAAGAAMFTLIRDDALELRADIAEGDLVRLEVGQTATLRLAGSGNTLTGKIRLVEPTIDNTSRLGSARIAIDDSTKVRSGMFVQAEILVTERETLSVPVTSVGASGRDATVMRVKDGVVELLTVSAGIRDGNWVEVTEGLDKGDLVVTKAGAFVRDGDKINPVPAEAATN